MKLTSKLAIFGIIAGLSASTAVMAEEAAPVVVTPPEETVVDEPIAEPADDTESPVLEKDTTDGDVTPSDDGGEVPIDWVKRGGELENPDVILYNMAGGGGQPSAAPAATASPADVAGKDEAATTTEAKTVTPVAPIVQVKKGPVALVKGARVFLRH
jgi:hypothetical protein